MSDTEWEEEAVESCAKRVQNIITDKYKSLMCFSRETGISISTLRGWSYSLQYPDIKILPILVQYLNTPADELLWNGGEWQIARRRIKMIKGNRREYVEAISEWKGRPFSTLLTNAILFEHGSISECASYMGMRSMTLENYASGASIPKTKYLKQICEYFNLSADDALATIELEVRKRESLQ